ncbi:MAG: Lipopolysaccharide export system ATP-binding protein LptB [Acidimicrobiales bacterium]|nr:Lipopolysaccharide export system ATP-binding protein LptB [Acidimicrobiales bacterium]
MSLLEAVSVTRTFAGIAALHDVSLEVGEAEVVGLIGPNGAGKTTLFNCIYGELRPSRGVVRFRGRNIGSLPPERRARLGLGRTFQRIELFPGMTVREHLLVAERSRNGRGGLLRDLLNKGLPTPDERVRADRVLGLLGIGDQADRPIESTSLGHSRLVELGRALMMEPRLLLLDEPSSGLDSNERTMLGDVFRSACNESGTSILLVEHDVEMVSRVTSRLYVLDSGSVIAFGDTSEVLADPLVRRAYIGDVLA